MTTPKERITASIEVEYGPEDPRGVSSYLMTYFSNDGRHNSCKHAINPTEHYCTVCGLEDSECQDADGDCAIYSRENIAVRYSEGIALALRVEHNHRMGDMYVTDQDPEDGAESYIYVTQATLEKEYGDDPEALEKAECVMRAELAELSAYATGNVWGFKIEKHTKCDCCDQETTEELDSCWGFYGDTDDVVDQMLDNAGWEHEQLLRDAWEKRYG